MGVSLSLSIHLLDALPPRAGARTLPIAVGVHASEKIVLAKNVSVVGLYLNGTGYGWDACIFGVAAAGTVVLWPGKSLYLVEDLVAHDAEVPEQPLPAGKFALRAEVRLFVARYSGEIGDPDEDPEHELRHLSATREIVIE